LEKQEQAKLKTSKRRDIIKIRAKIRILSFWNKKLKEGIIIANTIILALNFMCPGAFLST
jgi:hypothetical protein